MLNVYEWSYSFREKNYWEVREPNSRGITNKLMELGFTHGRMKTDTPRLDGRTINYSKTEDSPI